MVLLYGTSLPLAVSAGVLILAVCPGGVVSNTVSYLARADIPLSVTLTAMSSILALVTVPTGAAFWTGPSPECAAGGR